METTQRQIRKVDEGWKDLPSMEEPGSEAFIGDAHSNPDGCEMCSGFFELKKSEPLLYEYEYDEMKIVVEGELILEDTETGQVVHCRKHEVMYIPKGSKILFSTPSYGLAFYTGHRSFAP